MFLFRCHCCGSTFLLDNAVAGTVWHCPMSTQSIRFPEIVPSNFTEQQWLTWTEPNVLNSYINCKASLRKRRLLQCAFSRTLLDFRSRWVLRSAIETAEKCAEGLADETTREAAQINLLVPFTDIVLGNSRRHLMDSASRALEADVYCRSPAQTAAEKSLHCALIREVMGNPFRARPPIAQAWLASNDSAVFRVASSIYDERAFERLPILADALEDAGCDDADLLEHLRGPGPHVRGCFAVDFILEQV